MKLFLVILMLFALVVYGCAKETPSAEIQDTATADVNTNTPAAVDTDTPTAETDDIEIEDDNLETDDKDEEDTDISKGITNVASVEKTATETAQVIVPKESLNAPTTEFVEIKNFGFNQATLTVTKGTTVTWSQEDNTKHNIVSDDGYFESPLLKNGEKWSYTFNEAGTYKYHCAPHPYMTGTIVVE